MWDSCKVKESQVKGGRWRKQASSDLPSTAGLFSDITVNVPALQKSYALHSLMLSRSSMLYRQLLGLVHQHPPVIELDIAASPETIHTVLGHLYRPLTQHDLFFIVNEKPPQMCFELLDAAHELELDSLQNQIIHILPRSFNQNTILYWISTLLSQQQRRPWSDLVDQQIVHYLTSGLPRQLEGSPTSTCDHSEEEDEVKFGTCVKLPDPTDGWHDTLDDWARLYAELPLEYLKRCLEHKELMVKDSVERYKFAKRVLHFREKMGKRGLAVMLQFSSSDSNTGILIVKKQASKFGRWRPTAV
ncbi:hypothetical protein BJV82DRAFT_145729 [Fennellomyces sp. T-0311]|nr:hypothetical protein BJV82DRAFT_145729 [Fennellomyces sp. T-0311]